MMVAISLMPREMVETKRSACDDGVDALNLSKSGLVFARLQDSISGSRNVSSTSPYTYVRNAHCTQVTLRTYQYIDELSSSKAVAAT